MLETLFPRNILIPVVSSLLGVSLTPPVFLNVSVHFSSVPTFLGAPELEAVFRKKTTMQTQTFHANRCMCLICYLIFRHHCCWFKCRCLPLFYSLITIFLKSG